MPRCLLAVGALGAEVNLQAAALDFNGAYERPNVIGREFAGLGICQAIEFFRDRSMLIGGRLQLQRDVSIQPAKRFICQAVEPFRSQRDQESHAKLLCGFVVTTEACDAIDKFVNFHHSCGLKEVSEPAIAAAQRSLSIEPTILGHPLRGSEAPIRF